MPYFFASAHFNYARYGLLYLRSMQHLHPTLLKRFMAGEHVMHHTDGLWNGIWSDLFIESTYMRYGHGPSGIIGSTLSETTLAVWALSHNTMGQMSNDVAELCTHQDHVVMRHKEERPIRITDDSRDMHVIREAIASCIDVFDVGKHPENAVLDIFTGRVIDDPAVNVSNAVEIGICQMRAYESNWPAGFHASLSKKVKTIAGLPSHGKHAGGPPNTRRFTEAGSKQEHRNTQTD